MTCKENCLHYDACKWYENINEGHNHCDDICPVFEDKARFVELPCAVGANVYVIECCSCLNGYREPGECHHRITKATKYIAVVKCPSKRYTRCAKLYIRPFKAEWLSKIGRTVFFTREEAEKKLQEMKE